MEDLAPVVGVLPFTAIAAVAIAAFAYQKRRPSGVLAGAALGMVSLIGLAVFLIDFQR